MRALIRVSTYFVVSLVWIGSIQASELTEEEKQEYKDIFDRFDKDHDGGLSEEELKSFLELSGQSPSNELIKEFIKQNDNNGDGKVNLDEFLNFAKMSKNDSTGNDIEENWRKMFSLMDKEGKGEITYSALEAYMKQVGIPYEDAWLRERFNNADADHSGSLSFEEVKALMPTTTTQGEESKKDPAEAN